MKITKRQLKRLIREEVETLDYGKDYLSRTHPGGEGELADPELDYDHPSDVKAQRGSWAGGPNVHLHVDHGEASGGGPNTKGQEVMKVTESQLRRIIRHEKKKILESFGGTSARTGESFVDIAVNALLAGDYKSATEAVLNGYMMDDTWVSEEEALENTLMGIRTDDITPEEVQAAAEWWYTQYKDGMHAPQGQDEEREDWARAKAWASR